MSSDSDKTAFSPAQRANNTKAAAASSHSHPHNNDVDDDKDAVLVMSSTSESSHQQDQPETQQAHAPLELSYDHDDHDHRLEEGALHHHHHSSTGINDEDSGEDDIDASNGNNSTAGSSVGDESGIGDPYLLDPENEDDKTDTDFCLRDVDAGFLEQQHFSRSSMLLQFPSRSLEDRYVEFKYGNAKDRWLLLIVMGCLCVGNIGVVAVNEYLTRHQWAGWLQLSMNLGLVVTGLYTYIFLIRHECVPGGFARRQELKLQEEERRREKRRQEEASQQSMQVGPAPTPNNKKNRSQRKADHGGDSSNVNTSSDDEHGVVGSAHHSIVSATNFGDSKSSYQSITWSAKGGENGRNVQEGGPVAPGVGDAAAQQDADDPAVHIPHSLCCCTKIFTLPEKSLQQALRYETVGWISMMLGQSVALVTEVHAKLCLEQQEEAGKPEFMRGCYYRVYPYIILNLMVYTILFRFRLRIFFPIVVMVMITRGFGRVFEDVGSNQTFLMVFIFESLVGVIFAVVAWFLEQSDRSRFIAVLLAKTHTHTARKREAHLDSVLKAVLPAHAIPRMTMGEPVLDIAQCATVSVCDLVDFVQWSNMVLPEISVHAINAIVNIFDKELSTLGLQKVKTYGDRYVCCTPLGANGDEDELAQHHDDQQHQQGQRQQQQASVTSMNQMGPASLGSMPSLPGTGNGSTRSTPAASSSENYANGKTSTVRFGHEQQQAGSSVSHLDDQHIAGNGSDGITALGMGAANVFTLAFRQLRAVKYLNTKIQGAPLRAHVAIHTGHVFGAIVGANSVSYDVFGSAVTIASTIVQQTGAETIAASADSLVFPEVQHGFEISTSPLLVVDVPATATMSGRSGGTPPSSTPATSTPHTPHLVPQHQVDAPLPLLPPAVATQITHTVFEQPPPSVDTTAAGSFTFAPQPPSFSSNDNGRGSKPGSPVQSCEQPAPSCGDASTGMASLFPVLSTTTTGKRNSIHANKPPTTSDNCIVQQGAERAAFTTTGTVALNVFTVVNRRQLGGGRGHPLLPRHAAARHSPTNTTKDYPPPPPAFVGIMASSSNTSSTSSLPKLARMHQTDTGEMQFAPPAPSSSSGGSKPTPLTRDKTSDGIEDPNLADVMTKSAGAEDREVEGSTHDSVPKHTSSKPPLGPSTPPFAPAPTSSTSKASPRPLRLTPNNTNLSETEHPSSTTNTTATTSTPVISPQLGSMSTMDTSSVRGSGYGGAHNRRMLDRTAAARRRQILKERVERSRGTQGTIISATTGRRRRSKFAGAGPGSGSTSPRSFSLDAADDGDDSPHDESAPFSTVVRLEPPPRVEDFLHHDAVGAAAHLHPTGGGLGPADSMSSQQQYLHASSFSPAGSLITPLSSFNAPVPSGGGFRVADQQRVVVKQQQTAMNAPGSATASVAVSSGGTLPLPPPRARSGSEQFNNSLSDRGNGAAAAAAQRHAARTGRLSTSLGSLPEKAQVSPRAASSSAMVAGEGKTPTTSAVAVSPPSAAVPAPNSTPPADPIPALAPIKASGTTWFKPSTVSSSFSFAFKHPHVEHLYAQYRIHRHRATTIPVMIVLGFFCALVFIVMIIDYKLPKQAKDEDTLKPRNGSSMKVISVVLLAITIPICVIRCLVMKHVGPRLEAQPERMDERKRSGLFRSGEDERKEDRREHNATSHHLPGGQKESGRHTTVSSTATTPQTSATTPQRPPPNGPLAHAMNGGSGANNLLSIHPGTGSPSEQLCHSRSRNSSISVFVPATPSTASDANDRFIAAVNASAENGGKFPERPGSTPTVHHTAVQHAQDQRLKQYQAAVAQLDRDRQHTAFVTKLYRAESFIVVGLVMCLVYAGLATLHDSILNGDLTYLFSCFTPVLSVGMLIWPFIYGIPIILCLAVVPCCASVFYLQGGLFLSQYVTIPLMSILIFYFMLQREREDRHRFVVVAIGQLQLRAAKDDLLLQKALLHMLFPEHVVSTVVQHITETGQLNNNEKGGRSGAPQPPKIYMQKFPEVVVLQIRFDNLTSQVSACFDSPAEALAIIDRFFLTIEAILAKAKRLRKVHTMGDVMLIVGPLGDDREAKQTVISGGGGTREKKESDNADQSCNDDGPVEVTTVADQKSKVRNTASERDDLHGDHGILSYIQGQTLFWRSMQHDLMAGGSANNDDTGDAVGGGGGGQSNVGGMLKHDSPLNTNNNSLGPSGAGSFLASGSPRLNASSSAHTSFHPQRSPHFTPFESLTGGSTTNPHGAQPAVVHSNQGGKDKDGLSKNANPLVAPSTAAEAQAAKRNIRDERGVYLTALQSLRFLEELNRLSKQTNGIVNVSAMAVAGSVYGAVVGLDQATYDVMGVAVRRCVALLNAAPPQFIGVADSYRRVLIDGGCEYLPFSSQKQTWRVRGAGSATIYSIMDVDPTMAATTA